MDRYAAPHTFATRAKAEEWLATVRADMVRGTWRAPELAGVTLADYAADLVSVRADLAPRTRELYADLLRLWIAHDLQLPPAPGRAPRSINLGGMELGAVTVATVREWYAAAIHTAEERALQRQAASEKGRSAHDAPTARRWAISQGIDVKNSGRLPRAVLDAWDASGRPLAAPPTPRSDPDPTGMANTASHGANPPGRARVAQAYRFLHTVLQQAVRDRRIDANPCQISGAATVRAPERLPASPEQITALAAAMPPRWAAAVHVAAWSALRAGELFGLARRNVDLDAGTVRVERAVTYMTGAAPFLGSTKTENSRRTVHLPPHVLTILNEHMTRFTGPEPDALVFADQHGHIAPKEVRKQAFHRARLTIGRPDLSWHDLRHTGATLAAQSGATLKELQHRLGHSTPAAAMIYQHASADRDRELAQRMGLLAEPPIGNVHTITRDRSEASA